MDEGCLSCLSHQKYWQLLEEGMLSDQEEVSPALLYTQQSAPLIPTDLWTEGPHLPNFLPQGVGS